MACSCSYSSVDFSTFKLAAHNSSYASFFQLPCARISRASCSRRNAEVSLPAFPKLQLAPRKAKLWNPRWIVRAEEDEFEIEEVMDFEDEKEEEDENLADYETDYDVGKASDPDFRNSETFISTRGEPAESIVDYKIDEQEFHKLSLQHCDFFIRKVPDPDDDVYDFREMYVSSPDTDIYAIPRVEGRMPQKLTRLTKSNFEYICVSELPVDSLRAPMYKHENQVMKIFLIKHLKNRRKDHWNFHLDFEQIYVIDSKTKSISRAKVMLCVPGGSKRDRSEDLLVVRQNGTSFRVIPVSQRKTPDEVVLEMQWARTKEKMDNYLKSFRDYEKSNWF